MFELDWLNYFSVVPSFHTSTERFTEKEIKVMVSLNWFEASEDVLCEENPRNDPRLLEA